MTTRTMRASSCTWWVLLRTLGGWRVVGGATVKEVLVVAMAMAVVAGGRGMAREARESGRGRGGSLW